MSTFETIVRPFQLPRNSPAARVITDNEQSMPPVLIQIGRDGTGKVFNGSYSLTQTYYMTKYVVEKTFPIGVLEGG